MLSRSLAPSARAGGVRLARPAKARGARYARPGVAPRSNDMRPLLFHARTLAVASRPSVGLAPRLVPLSLLEPRASRSRGSKVACPPTQPAKAAGNQATRVARVNALASPPAPSRPSAPPASTAEAPTALHQSERRPGCRLLGVARAPAGRRAAGGVWKAGDARHPVAARAVSCPIHGAQAASRSAIEIVGQPRLVDLLARRRRLAHQPRLQLTGGELLGLIVVGQHGRGAGGGRQARAGFSRWFLGGDHAADSDHAVFTAGCQLHFYALFSARVRVSVRQTPHTI